MILIITHKTDFTTDFVIDKLNKRNIPYKRFNCEDLFRFEYSLQYNEEFKVSILGEQNFKSVWFRRLKFPEIEGTSQEEKAYILNEVDALFKNLFSTINAKWFSLPSAVYRAENKLLQLKTAQDIGLKVPNTLVTNSKDRLKNFYLENGRNIIIKPLSQTRISYKDKTSFLFTNVVPEHVIEAIEEYDLTPCIFQENIAKDYELRITVVGEDVFAASVYSQQDLETQTDWRRKKLSFFRAELPQPIADLCIKLVKALNLEFGAIDMIKTPEGKYIFLEINPNGQWAWIEAQTGQKISDSIIKFLHE